MAEIIYEILAPGISWLEIPKVDLRILCGCPADAVKHLTSKGKIRLVTENGATFETVSYTHLTLPTTLVV